MSHSIKALPYYCNGVGWPRDNVDEPGGLSDMIDGARMITRKTFLQHVDRAQLQDLEFGLSYEKHPKKGLTMAGDYAVSYHRSKLNGFTVYYFRQSSIEYVFVPWEFLDVQKKIEKINKMLSKK